MDLSNEILEKAMTAKNAEELLEMAKAENIKLSAEEAAKAFAELHQSGELSDEELDNVAGGCGDSNAKKVLCSKCYSANLQEIQKTVSFDKVLIAYKCQKCGHKFVYCSIK